jgi:hypothetical protein
MKYPTMIGSAGLALLSAGLASEAEAQPYQGIYATANVGSDGATLDKGDRDRLQSAFANPFISGVEILTDWRQVEPLPPGLNFVAPDTPVTLSLPGTKVNISCHIPGSISTTDGNYCYDTVDSVLKQIALSTRPANVTTPSHTFALPPLAIALSILAGPHSPVWLSDGTLVANTDTDTGVDVFIQSSDVTAATAAGSYASVGTVSCSFYAASSGGTTSGSGSLCGYGQTFTSWIGYGGGSANSTSTLTTCQIVRLPVPYGTATVGSTTNLSPAALQYVNMLSVLKTHIQNAPQAFGKITVVKLGAAYAGQDAEYTLLGGNDLNTLVMELYPPEVGTLGVGTIVSDCDGPAGTMSSFYNSVWQNRYSYNPRYVEQNWEYIANAVGTLFNNSSAGTSVLLNLDVLKDVKVTFPFIPFQESNSNTSTIYALNPPGASNFYSYNADGPIFQDDVALCDLVGTYTPSAGSTVTLTPVQGSTSSTITYHAGFFGTGTNHCLTGNRTHAHQPLLFSLPNGYQWGIEEDGLTPVQLNLVNGIYAQGIARNFGLELSWGLNGGQHASCGQTVSSNGSTVTQFPCDATAITQTSTCGTAYDGSTITCWSGLGSRLITSS